MNENKKLGRHIAAMLLGVLLACVLCTVISVLKSEKLPVYAENGAIACDASLATPAPTDEPDGETLQVYAPRDAETTAAPLATSSLTTTAAQDKPQEIRTCDDMRKLLIQMLADGTYTAHLTAFTLTDQERASVTEEFADILSWSYQGYEGNMDFSITVYTGKKIWMAVSHNDLSSLSTEEKDLYDKAVAIVNSIIRPGMSDYEKALAVHDYIALHTVYEINGSLHTESVEGVLDHGRAQCSGYTDAFYLLGRMCGLEIERMAGDILEDGEGHAWDLIRLDGMWYAVDVTWDDTIQTEADPDFVQHLYFNIPLCMLDQDRETANHPTAEGAFAQSLDQNNWYIRNGKYVSTSDEAEKVLSELDGNSYVDFLFAGDIDRLSAVISKYCNYSVSYSYGGIAGQDLTEAVVERR